MPEHIRSDNGSEFTATTVRDWLAKVGVKTLYIEPGRGGEACTSPWENGYVESFNGKLADELLDREILYSLEEAKVLIAMWRRHYNTIRPHSALGYKPPAPESLAAEQRLVVGNRELIERFEKKIQQTLARVWGEAPASDISEVALPKDARNTKELVDGNA